MSMDTDSTSSIDLEDVALELLHALHSVMPSEEQSKLHIDEMDTEQAPGLMLKIMEAPAKKYRPSLRDDYKSVIQEEFGYTF